VAQARQNSSSELVRELAADTHGTGGFGLTAKPEAVETETIASLQTAKTALQSKAPDELEAYRQFVLDVAQSVAAAAGGGDTAEAAVVEKVTSALN
jgi:hypothetical protein